MNRWQHLEESFGTLPARQRVMIAAAAVLLTVLPMLSYVIMPDLERAAALSAENKRLNQQIEQVLSAVNELEGEFDEDINEPLRQEIRQLQMSASNARQSVENSATLQEVSQRREFLNSVLNTSDALEIQSLTAKEPRKVFETGSIALYEHAVEAVFTGTYFDVLAFVRALQSQHPNVIWAHFDYQVKRYPQGQITLEWHLLSTDKEFISG